MTISSGVNFRESFLRERRMRSTHIFGLSLRNVHARRFAKVFLLDHPQAWAQGQVVYTLIIHGANITAHPTRKIKD